MKILMICWFDPHGIQAVKDHINGIREYSKHTIEICNMFYPRLRVRKYFQKRISKYDGIIFHNTVTYNIDTLNSWCELFQPSLKDFRGIKIVFKQDEMRRVSLTNSLIRDWKIDAITTCLPESEIEKVYISTGKLKFMRTFTGYVTPGMKEFVPKRWEDRKWDVVYRGMETPFEWGRLGYEKYEIGIRFPHEAVRFGLKMNVSVKNSDRLGGRKWIELLNNSRTVLASESGASIFDFDGKIEEMVGEFRKTYPDGDFERAYSEFLHRYEGNIKYNQISPRHLEAAMTRTVQILYEGEYSRLIKPWTDYIPLKRDYSNIEEIVQTVADKKQCESISNSCFRSLIENEDLQFKAFVTRLDNLIVSLRGSG